MSNVMTSASFEPALKPGIEKIFGDTDAYRGLTYQDVFEIKKSKAAWEEDMAISAFGLAARANEGGSYMEDLSRWLYTQRATHDMYMLGFAVTEVMLEDLGDNMPIITKATQWLRRSLEYTKDVVAWNVINLAADSGTTYGDGKPLASTTHPSSAGTFSNYVSSDLSEATLETAMINISRFKDDRGLYLGLNARRLVIPNESMFVAERLLHTNLRPGTTDNDANALKNLGFLQQAPVVVPHLTLGNGVFFIQTDADNGLVFYDRVASTVKVGDDFESGNTLVKARARFCATVFNPKAVYFSDGA